MVPCWYPFSRFFSLSNTCIITGYVKKGVKNQKQNKPGVPQSSDSFMKSLIAVVLNLATSWDSLPCHSSAIASSRVHWGAGAVGWWFWGGATWVGVVFIAGSVESLVWCKLFSYCNSWLHLLQSTSSWQSNWIKTLAHIWGPIQR